VVEEKDEFEGKISTPFFGVLILLSSKWGGRELSEGIAIRDSLFLDRINVSPFV